MLSKEGFQVNHLMMGCGGTHQVLRGGIENCTFDESGNCPSSCQPSVAFTSYGDFNYVMTEENEPMTVDTVGDLKNLWSCKNSEEISIKSPHTISTSIDYGRGGSAVDISNYLECISSGSENIKRSG